MNRTARTFQRLAKSVAALRYSKECHFFRRQRLRDAGAFYTSALQRIALLRAE